MLLGEKVNGDKFAGVDWNFLVIFVCMEKKVKYTPRAIREWIAKVFVVMIVYSENLSIMLPLFCRADPRPLKDSYILPFCRALGAIWGEINSSRKLAIFLQLDRMRQTISIFPRHYLQHLPHHHHHLKHCRVVSWWPVWENKLLRFHYSGICALGLDGIVG